MDRVLVALSPLPEVFEEAEEKGTDFLLLHHPLISDPPKSIVTSSYPGGFLTRAISNGLAVYAAHTSYDAAPAGVSVALAKALDLHGPPSVLSPRGTLRKLVVFVPEENVDAMAKALAGPVQVWSVTTQNALSGHRALAPSAEERVRIHTSGRRAGWRRSRRYASRPSSLPTS